MKICHRYGYVRKLRIATLGLAVALAACGPGGAGPTSPAGATAVPANAAGAFCDAAARLELADASNRQSIQAGLEAGTPAALVDAVAVIRTFMERQAKGDDPYKDPDFLLEYDHAVRAIWKHCGIHQD